MRRKTVAVLFLLAALLTTPWASAAPRHGGGRPAAVSGMVGMPEVLAQVWSFLRGVWRKVGCNIDPNGITVETGCHIDPNGQCQSSATPVTSADTGCQIDPFGRCGS